MKTRKKEKYKKIYEKNLLIYKYELQKDYKITKKETKNNNNNCKIKKMFRI